MISPMQRIVLGTAGHIDHGKTSLIESLTGKNTDRLPEEKKRGISIELGFAPLPLESDLLACVVDVPGHEKFVHTMISGAAGIDVFLLVVAANEGVKAQTLEHLDVLRLLGVQHGVCALTKTDLASEEQLRKTQEDVKKLLPSFGFSHVPIVVTSANTGSGLPEVKSEIAQLARKAREKVEIDERSLLFFVDRVFSLPGQGCIVTGTLSDGKITKGEKLTILPKGRLAQVRSLQIFDEFVEVAKGETRLAINLSGISREDLGRGDSLSRETELLPSKAFHVKLDWANGKAPKKLTNLRFLLGTQDFLATFLPHPSLRKDSKPSFGMIRLSKEAALRCHDKFILRMASPARTIAGGLVLDPHPSQRLSQVDFPRLSQASLREKMLLWVEEAKQSIPLMTLARRASLPVTVALETLKNSVSQKKIISLGGKDFVSQENFEIVSKEVIKHIAKNQNATLASLVSGKIISSDPILMNAVIEDLKDKDQVLIKNARASLPSQRTQKRSVHPAVSLIRESGFTPPSVEELAKRLGQNVSQLRKTLAEAAVEKELVRVNQSLYYAPEAMEKLQASIRSLLGRKKEITIGDWKNEVGLTRKYAVPLLEHLDRERWTICRPDRSRVPGPRLT